MPSTTIPRAGYRRYDLTFSEPGFSGASAGRFVFVHANSPHAGGLVQAGFQEEGRSGESGSGCTWGPTVHVPSSLLGSGPVVFLPLELAPCEGPHRVDRAPSRRERPSLAIAPGADARRATVRAPAAP